MAVLTGYGQVDKLARLMSGLPQYIEPLRLAEAGATVAGDVPVAALSRLAALLAGPGGRVHVELTFMPAGRGIVLIDGFIDVSIPVTCQRCLDPFELRQRATVRLGVLPESLNERELPPGHEALEPAGRIALAELVEDEILLALPLAPVHAAGDCSGRAGGEDSKPERDNPFRVLKDIGITEH